MVPVSELPKFGAEDSKNLNKLLSLAEPGVSRYGDRRRHKSGQSDTSVSTVSTTHTNRSEPIPSNQKTRKARPPGLPSAPSVNIDLENPREKKKERHRDAQKEVNREKSNRPISEHFGTINLTPTESTKRVRQKSVDNSAPNSKSERAKTEGKSSRSYHRSTPDLLQAPINPIYQPSNILSSPIKVNRNRGGAFYVSGWNLTDV